MIVGRGKGTIFVKVLEHHMSSQLRSTMGTVA